MCAHPYLTSATQPRHSPPRAACPRLPRPPSWRSNGSHSHRLTEADAQSILSVVFSDDQTVKCLHDHNTSKHPCGQHCKERHTINHIFLKYICCWFFEISPNGHWNLIWWHDEGLTLYIWFGDVYMHQWTRSFLIGLVMASVQCHYQNQCWLHC